MKAHVNDRIRKRKKFQELKQARLDRVIEGIQKIVLPSNMYAVSFTESLDTHFLPLSYREQWEMNHMRDSAWDLIRGLIDAGCVGVRREYHEQAHCWTYHMFIRASKLTEEESEEIELLEILHEAVN